MESKILSLDLGSNSIGATLRDLTDTENQFKKTTVTTFETGVGKDDKGKYTLSHAAERTSKRSLRRLYQSRKYKLWETLKLLGNDKKYCPIEPLSLKRWRDYDKGEAMKGNGGRAYPVDDIPFDNWIKLDFDEDGIPDYTSPYALRDELATKKLDFELEANRFKLGRSLYHIAQHRGFKSSKKVQNADDEKDDNEGEDYSKDKGAESKKRNNFWKEIDKLNLEIDHSKTVGETFSAVEKYNTKSEVKFRIRKDLHQYVTRKMLMQEVEVIFKFQDISFGSIFKNSKGQALKISQSPMFWQRPLRSQKGTIGKCTLEPNKYRCPISHPDFEEFRAWGFLNNIQYKLIGDVKGAKWQQIPFNYRQELFNDKFFRVSKKDFFFGEIAEWIKRKNQHDKWELNYSYKTNVAACPVSARLKDIFGENWREYQLITSKIRHIQKTDGSYKEHQITYNIEDIWHILFESDDEDFVEDFALARLGLDEKRTNKFLGLNKAMPVAYGMLSLKAIRNILPFLKDYGLIYPYATLLAKVPKILGNEIWENNKHGILESLQTEVIDKNRDEKRSLNIVNNLIAQYKSLPEGEKFAKNNKNYQLYERDSLLSDDSQQSDANQILKATTENIGKITWDKMSITDQTYVLNDVAVGYQSFFQDEKFKKLPNLQLAMKHYLADQFDDLKCPDTFKELKDEEKPCNCAGCKKLNSLYHPSQIAIYPPAKEEFYRYGSIQKRMVMLGSPQTGAFKNPMAMRALHELRKYINYLIATEQIDEQTRIVVEIPRDSNLDDNNRRWAWTEYQNRREAENKEFRDAIYGLLKDADGINVKVNPDNASDIDKFRLWYEMLEGTDIEEGFTKEKKIIPLEKTTFSKKNKKGQEEEFEEFNEDNYLKINRSLYFKLQEAKENIQEKYKLWKQQGCRCIYTGKIIKISDLFEEDIIDFEHTIARSRSLDNSLANRTVSYKDFNRNIKKNKIPSELENYDKPAYGYDGSILSRIEKWEQKVKDIELHIEYWKTQSKRGSKSKMISPTSNISEKDFAIRQRHLWEFELKYWKDKVSRFTMKEITSGFRKSQLVDTQIISKYALHYLKTFFNTVDVQKGANTAEFRKIFGIQQIGTQKDRSKHSHHAKDAIILSLIPSPILREQILTVWYKIQEQENLLTSDTEPDKYTIQQEIDSLKDKLFQLKQQCNLPKNLNGIVNEVDNRILINNISKDQTLVPAKKRVRSRGKIVPLKDRNGIIYQTEENGNNIHRTLKDGSLIWKTNQYGELMLDEKGNKVPVYLPKEKWAKGDVIRGQLHKESFFGAIRLRKKDLNGKYIKDINDDYELEDVKHVIREDLIYKKDDQSPGFKTLKEIENIIVDKALFGIIKTQIEEVGDFREALKNGIWMVDRKGNKVHKIRHIRCFVTPKGEINVKKHSHLSKHTHKQYIISENAETPYYGLYTDREGNCTSYDCRTLWQVAEIKSGFATHDIENLFEKKEGENLIVLRKQQRLFLLKDKMEKYKDLSVQEQSSRIYNIMKFYKNDGRILMQRHLDARDNKTLKIDFPEDGIDSQGKKFGKSGINGFSEQNFDNPHHRLLLSKKKFNFLIEGKHFEIKPDGEIKWK